jgi:aldehyde dehydrogenase (NAD+)
MRASRCCESPSWPRRGFPDGALNLVTGLDVTRARRSPRIRHRAPVVHRLAGDRRECRREAAKRHCPVTLELGGKGPQIVFADADLNAALPVIVNAIVQNAGQTCSAGSRLLVERSRYEEVLEKLGARFAALAVGPALADLDCGPLIRAGQRDRVRTFLAGAERDGIRTVAKGAIVADAPEGGYYVEPRLLRDVPPTSRIACEEVFGPVLVAMLSPTSRCDTPRQRDGIRARGRRLDARRRKATADGPRYPQRSRCSSTTTARGGVELPFGGVKHSGHGREKGFEALYGYTVLKTVVLQHG